MSASAVFSHPHRGSRQRGFSLIELLVGVAIGLVGMAVIFQTIKTWDTHSRSTASGGEADSTGTLAMFNIERDLKQAGMGIGKSPSTTLGCMVQAQNSTLTPAAFHFSLVPVMINPASPDVARPPLVVSDLNSDVIATLSGNSSFFVDAATLLSSTATTKTLGPSAVQQLAGFQLGDLAVAADTSGNCQLIEITSNTPIGVTLTHASGTSYTNFYTSTAASGATFNGGTAVTFPGGGTLFSLGPNPQRTVWWVQGGRLFKLDNLHSTTPLAIAAGVVSIKADYGIDANNDNQISPSEWTTTPPAPPTPTVDWRQLRAVRIAILVRSKQYERTADPDQPNQVIGVTSAAPTWANGAHTFTMSNIDGTADSFTANPNTADPNNWRFYRYRVYQKEVPLRNMIWGTAPPS